MTIEKEVIDGTLPFIREKPRDIALVSAVIQSHLMLSDKKAAGEVLLTVLFTQPIYSPGGGRAPGAVLPRGLRPDGRRHVVQERPHLHGRRQGRCRRNCRGLVIAGY